MPGHQFSKDTMADSFWQGTADGSTSVFAVPFPYISQNDLIVQCNGVSMLTPGDYVFLNAGSIQFKTNPPKGTTVNIARQTSPDSKLVTFANGANLTAADLNKASLQNFYRTQELQDQLNAYITSGVAKYSVTGANPFITPDGLIQAAADAVLNTALAQTLQQRITDIDQNAQDILAQTTRTDTLQATIDSISSNIPGGIGTYLTNETNSRIAGDQALANTIAIIGATNGAGTAFVLHGASVYVDATTSLSDRLSQIASQFGSATAAITNEATTRATADTVNANAISSLTATVSGNYGTLTAAIGAEQTARANADSANASNLSALQATVSSNNSSLSASITNEQSARASGDQTNATAISSLSTTVNGNTASIQTQQTTLNGLSAQYTVKVDNNGHVAGFGLASTATNGQTISDFIVLANRFSVIDPNNGSAAPTVPFTVQNGVCYMQNVVVSGALIQDATITGAKIANASISTAQIATASITSALIANAAITSAQIANLSVTNAHIANLSVDTSKIAQSAVTSAAGATNVSGNFSTSLTTICSVSYPSQGGVLVISTSCSIDYQVDQSGNSAYGFVPVSVTINGTTYDVHTFDVSGRFGSTVMAVLPPGTYNIQLQGYISTPSDTGGTISWAYASLVVVEYKR